MARIYAKLHPYIDREGLQDIVIYASGGGLRGQRSIGYRVSKDHFDPITGEVTSGEVNYRNINAVIRAKIGEWEQERVAAEVTGSRFSPLINQTRQVTFYDFCSEESAAADVTDSTREKYFIELKKLKEYDSKTVPRDLSPEWIHNYRRFMTKNYPGKTTLHNSFKFLKKMVGCAKRAGLIKEDIFINVDLPKKPETDKLQYLEPEQTVSLQEFLFTEEGYPFKRAGLWQLYGCYSGLRYSDWSLKELPLYLREGKIELTQTKTTGHVSIPLYPQLRTIIQELIKFNEPPMTNQQHNLACKAMAPIARLPKDMTSHWGRHTFGVYLAYKDVPPQVAMKLMGHKNIRETMIYYEITPRKVAETVAKLLG